MHHYDTSEATEQTPCPVSRIEPRQAWLRFGLVLTGCMVGGFGLGVLIAVVIGRRLWEAMTGLAYSG